MAVSSVGVWDVWARIIHDPVALWKPPKPVI